MNGTRTYQIEINGLKQSVDMVDSLNKQLDVLGQRIEAINQKQAALSQGSGSASKRVSEMTAEQKIADQINQSYEKRLALEGELGKQLAN